MTPAEEALKEAARAESARVYGQLCPEHHNTPVAPAETRFAVIHDIEAARRRKDIA